MTPRLAVPCLIGAILALSACSSAGPPDVATAGAPVADATAAAQQPALPPGHPPLDAAGSLPTARGRVVETMDSGGYTYVRVQPADGKELWAASTELPVKVGDQVVVDIGMPMENYESASLKRTFDLVYFSEKIEVVGGQQSLLRQMASVPVSQAAPPAGHGRAAAAAAGPIDLTGIARAEGGLTVAELVAQAAAQAGKSVAVRGRVVKFTPAVMGKNWLHVRDGSGENGDADVTVTTGDEAAIGDLVVVRGTVATNRDLGSGYSYAVLIEDAKLER